MHSGNPWLYLNKGLLLTDIGNLNYRQRRRMKLIPPYLAPAQGAFTSPPFLRRRLPHDRQRE